MAIDPVLPLRRQYHMDVHSKSVNTVIKITGYTQLQSDILILCKLSKNQQILIFKNCFNSLPRVLAS